MWRKVNHCDCWQECKFVQSPQKTVWSFLKKKESRKKWQFCEFIDVLTNPIVVVISQYICESSCPVLCLTKYINCISVIWKMCKEQELLFKLTYIFSLFPPLIYLLQKKNLFIFRQITLAYHIYQLRYSPLEEIENLT